MTQLTRRHLLSLVGASGLAACTDVAAPPTVLGLTEDPFEGGIGGTGIVGLMIGAGSVLINGLRVELDSGTRVYAAGRRSGHDALAAGRVLTILARTTSAGHHAQRIDIDDPLTGTLRRVGARFAVNGSTIVAGPSLQAHDGARVTVAGLWQADGSIRASALLPATDADDIVTGTLVGGTDTGWRIGATPLALHGGALPVAGQFAVARGTFRDGVLNVSTLQLGRFREGAAGLRNLSVEGFLEPVATAPGFRVAGLGHSFDARLDLTPWRGRRALFFGAYTGDFLARRALSLPNAQAARAALLRPQPGQTSAQALRDARAVTQG